MDNIFAIAIVGIITFSRVVYGDDKDMGMKMLKKYQYMGENHPDPDMRGDEMYGEALMNFQNFAGLNETGELDNQTMAMLMSPRCGVPDIMDKGSMMKRKKRYALDGSKWVGTILYNFKSYTKSNHIDASDIRQTVRRALDEWSKYADLAFKEITETGDIEISFEKGDHGDGYPLDGPGMTLAHAFFPNRGGDVHFDEDEKWMIRSKDGKDLYYTSLHELGHSLGLQHSAVKEAIMFPFYPGYVPDLKLRSDDIAGIRTIYGKRKIVAPTTTGPLSTTPPPDGTLAMKEQFCGSGTVDAIGTLNGKLFVFQGDMYAELDSKGIKPGFPRHINSSDWEGLPNNLDAALGLENSMVTGAEYQMLLLFKDQQYWRYVWGPGDKPELVDGYPREIQKDFTSGLPSSVDAVYTWSDNNRIYIVKDDEYYRVRENRKVFHNKLRLKCDRWYFEYPKDFSENWNIMETVSDVLMYDGRTFFFTGDEYYRYNDNKYKPDNGYPRKTAASWFGCLPPGSLNAPDMEMDMMKTQSQFDEIPASIQNSNSAARINAGRYQEVLMTTICTCIIFQIISAKM